MLSTDKSVIPVCKPKLPSYKEIIPYLKKIDNNRFYSNFGPLSNSLEERISQRLGYSKNVVALSSSGTKAFAANRNQTGSFADQRRQRLWQNRF